MKRKSIIAVTALTFCLNTGTAGFASKSISRHWARNEILYLRNNGVMTRDNIENFRPDDFITRAEFMNAINDSFGYETGGEVNFKDVSKNSWYYDDIRKAVAAGYIGGYDDGSIKPGASLTREEAAKIIAIASGLEKELPQSIHRFKDVDQMGRWSIVYVHILAEKGYMSGYEDGTFRPRNKLKRAEAASILANIKRDMGGFTSNIDRFKSRGFSVQTASFSNLEFARGIKEKLNRLGYDRAFIVKYRASNNYSVLVDAFLEREQAESLKSRLSLDSINSFISARTFTQEEIVEKPGIVESPYGKEGARKEEKPAPSKGGYLLQSGSFSSLEAALAHKQKLVRKGFSKTEIYKFKNSKLYFVIVDSGLKVDEAKSLNNYVQALGFETYVSDKNLRDAHKI